MDRLTYAQLKAQISEEEYRNYRIVVKSTQKEYRFREFIDDLDYLYSHRYPVNGILQSVRKNSSEPENDIIIQKMVLKPATDLGIEGLEGFGYQAFDDFAVFSPKNEFEMLKSISAAVEDFITSAAKCFGSNDPVY